MCFQCRNITIGRVVTLRMYCIFIRCALLLCIHPPWSCLARCHDNLFAELLLLLSGDLLLLSDIRLQWRLIRTQYGFAFFAITTSGLIRLRDEIGLFGGYLIA